MSVRVSVPAIRNQTGRQFNVDKVDGVSRRHSPSLSLPAGSAVMDYPSRFVARALMSLHYSAWVTPTNKQPIGTCVGRSSVHPSDLGVSSGRVRGCRQPGNRTYIPDAFNSGRRR